MDIKGEYRIAASRDRVWASLNDPETLKRCIPGCESLEKVSESQVEARILAKIGPVKSRFDTRIELTNLNPPSSYTLIGEGKGGVAGFGKGSAEVTLEEEGEVTVLRYVAVFKVGGKLAQVGSRLVAGATRKTADDFFSCFSTLLDPGAEKVEPVEVATPMAFAGNRRILWIAAGLVAAAIVLWLALS